MPEATLRFAQKALIQREGKILFIRRSPKETASNVPWDAPGGRLEFGEGLEEGLRREIREEVSLEVGALKLLHLFTWFPRPGFQLVVAIYLATAADASTPVLSDECAACEWMEPAIAAKNNDLKQYHAALRMILAR